MEEQKKKSIGQMIDSTRIKNALLKHKSLYLKTLPAAFIVGVLWTLGIPNYYKCQVSLAPEDGSGAGLGSLASLASSFGVNIGGGSNKAGDAITPVLYPDLMNSTEFRTSMFDVKVQMDGDDRVMTYYDYLDNEQKSPWWSEVKSAIFGIFKSKKPVTDTVAKKDTVNPFRLTIPQAIIASAIAGNIECKINRKTDVIDITVTDQDPLVAATIADSVSQRLQAALTEYRTKKARHDLAYIETLYAEAKDNYEKACEQYADFMDHNQDVVMESVRLRQTKLENRMQLYYNNFNAISAQLLAAKAKVQEVTPAFTTLQNATVPLIKAGPKRSRIVVIFVLIVFLCTTTWILWKEDEIKPLLGLKRKEKEE